MNNAQNDKFDLCRIISIICDRYNITVYFNQGTMRKQ